MGLVHWSCCNHNSSRWLCDANDWEIHPSKLAAKGTWKIPPKRKRRNIDTNHQLLGFYVGFSEVLRPKKKKGTSKSLSRECQDLRFSGRHVLRIVFQPGDAFGAFIALTWFRKVLILVCNDLATSTVWNLSSGSRWSVLPSSTTHRNLFQQKNSKYLTFLANHFGMKGLHHIKFGGCSLPFWFGNRCRSQKNFGVGLSRPPKPNYPPSQLPQQVRAHEPLANPKEKQRVFQPSIFRGELAVSFWEDRWILPKKTCQANVYTSQASISSGV